MDRHQRIAGDGAGGEGTKFLDDSAAYEEGRVRARANITTKRRLTGMYGERILANKYDLCD